MDMNQHSSTRHRVTLREITPANRAEVETLQVSASQRVYVDGVAQSLDEAAANPDAQPWCRAIYAGDTPVGFLMIGDDVPPGNKHIPWRYYLWRMLIDGRYQRLGYGRAALDRLTGHLRSRPGADVLVTSVVPGPGSPLGFYLRYGFERTGEWFDHEEVLRLSLDTPAGR
jgi:diamine N-acetyltransferase